MKSQHGGGRAKKKALFEKERDVWRDSGKITMRGVLKPPFMSPKESKHAQEGLKKIIIKKK